MVGANALVISQNARRMSASGNEGGVQALLGLMAIIFVIAAVALIFEAWEAWNRTE